MEQHPKVIELFELHRIGKLTIDELEQELGYVLSEVQDHSFGQGMQYAMERMGNE